MTDTNKERAEFEARYASQPDATAEPERSGHDAAPPQGAANKDES